MSAVRINFCLLFLSTTAADDETAVLSAETFISADSPYEELSAFLQENSNAMITTEVNPNFAIVFIKVIKFD